MWLWGGTSSTSLQKEVIDVSKQDFYSADHLLALLDSLRSFEIIDDKNRDLTIEILRQVAEVLVWGEQHNRGYFDIFCEQNVLSYFVSLAEQPAVPNAVKVQLLQTLSIIVQSINKETAVYYMFSNNYINALLSTKFDFEDEEVASWYVSFIKSLSLLVNPDTIKLFLNERAKHFPIYSEAVKFFIAKDSMIRTHCRNVTLCILRVQDPALRSFLLSRSIFFSHVACYLRELLDDQFSRLESNNGANLDVALRDGVCEIEEMLFYIQDIFNLNIDPFSDLLASRLLVYCYIPVIGLLGTPPEHEKRWERGKGGVVDEGKEVNETPDASSQTSGGAEDEPYDGSQSWNMESISSRTGDKKLQQGWMWGWSSVEDLQDAPSAGEASDSLNADRRQPLNRRSISVDLNGSWRARAARAMSPDSHDLSREREVGSPIQATGEERTVSASLAGDAERSKAQTTASCDHTRRFILFFLIQTLNCIQSEKLIRPILAALLFHRLPRPLRDLLLAAAPVVPPAYNHLRNPTECSGQIERFLPTKCLSSTESGEWVHDRRPETPTDNGQAGATDVVSCQPDSPTTKRLEAHTACLSLDDRIQMLKDSMEAFQILRVFGEADGTTAHPNHYSSAHIDTSPSFSENIVRGSETCHARQTEVPAPVPAQWCHNPIQFYLLSLLDGREVAQRQCDADLLLLGLLMQSALRHPCTTKAALVHARIVPCCGVGATSGPGRSSNRFCDASAPSTSETTLALSGESQDPENHSLMDSGSNGESRETLMEGRLWPSAGPAVTPVARPVPHSTTNLQLEILQGTDYGRLSWSFIAQMLDSIQAHLSSTFLRPITVRVAIAVIATLVTSHVLKVQSSEYRVRCMERLVESVLRLRRSAAVATKLCLSALSDGHTIDVFWDEWEVHRSGALNDAALFRDVRILECSQSSRADSRNSAFPPYLLVAVTDQEIERRSVQVFLLFRRLHRDLSTILRSIETRPSDVLGLAREASGVLGGLSSEPNPFESEDNAELTLHTTDDDSKITGADSRARLSLEGRNFIRCTVETSSGPAIRYCVQDDKRLLLVSPSSTLPGVADIRTSHPLRNVECRLKKNSSRCLQLLVLDVMPPTDGSTNSPSRGPHEKPPTMQISLTAPPLNGEIVRERPALWEIRLQFADVIRCNTVFHILQKARAGVRRTLASHIDALLEDV